MNNRTVIFGLILIVVGTLILFRTLDLFYYTFGDIMSFLVPLGCIVFGIWLIIRKRRQESIDQANAASHEQFTSTGPAPQDVYTGPHEVKPEPVAPPPPPRPDQKSTATGGTASGASTSQASSGPGTQSNQVPPSPTYSDGKTRYSGFFGDLFVDCKNTSVQNVEVSAFIGDVEVKLHDAVLDPGLSRMVISGFIGDIRVLVPRGMAVFANGSSFVGDIEIFGRRSSGFGNNIDGQSENYREAPAKLYIAINSFVGDIRVYEV